MKTLAKMAAVAVLAIAMMSCKSTPKYELTDGEWALFSWHTDNGEEMIVTQNKATMTFAPDNKLNGNAGCNGFTGRYELKEGNEIKIEMGAMTLKMCMDMEVEDRMVMKMPNVTSYKIDGNQLILFDHSGKEAFRFDNTVKKEE